MKSDQLTTIQNSVYELQGLLQLALNGSGDQALIRKLIISKSKYILSLSEALSVPDPEEMMAKAASFEEEEDSAPSPGSVPPLSEMNPAAKPVTEDARKPAPAVPPLPKDAQSPRQQFSLRKTPGRSPVRKLFHLNDTFRFRRELFAGSQEDFDASLCIVSEFTDFAQAEDYFYNDLQWDPERPEVIDFMNVIRRYINER